MAEGERPMFVQVPEFPAPHAFTTREGGVSAAPFATANLGASVGDDPEAVTENRKRVLAAFGATLADTAFVHQVHGANVVDGEETVGDRAGEQRADALICDDPGVTLAVSIADCLPLLIWDGTHQAVAAVHAGWRGVLAGVVEATLVAMYERFGSLPETLRFAIGPHIRQAAYQVGPDVHDAFLDAGFPASVLLEDAEKDDHYRLSVESAVRIVLDRYGVPDEAIASGGWCTASEPKRFFSHRRDRGATGRHWALIRAPRSA